MTPRDVGIVIEAEMWRLQREARRELAHAWQAAAFQRAEKLPSLQTMMGRFDKAAKRQEERGPSVRDVLLEFARNNGLKVTRHAKPVMKAPLPPPKQRTRREAR